MEEALVSSHPKASRKTRSSRGLTLALSLVGVAVAVSVALVVFLSYGAPGESNGAAQRQVRALADSVIIKLDDQQIELAVEGRSAFRVSVSFDGTPHQLPTQMLGQQIAPGPFTKVSSGSLVGISTTFGQVLVDTTSGALILKDAAGNVISQSPSKFATSTLSSQGTGDVCKNPVPDYDVNSPDRTPGCPDGFPNESQESCCGKCNDDPDCTVFVFATQGHESEGKNCWLLKGSDVALHQVDPGTRVVGGSIQAPPPKVHLTLGKSSGAQFYGSGCGGDDCRSLTHTGGSAEVSNTVFYTPRVYSSDGFSTLVVSQLNFTDTLNKYPVEWHTNDQDQEVQWTADGSRVDVYLSPASDLQGGLATLWDLTGFPAVPPRHAFGFIACRWGWTDYDYIVDNLKQFRDGRFPIDSWISDFEWYTPEPDYLLPDEGLDDFEDFSYNPKTFPDPVNNLKTYHEQLHVRFGGIRKPRLGNKALISMAKSKGWTVAAPAGGGAAGNTRNLNYSIPALQKWYANNTIHFHYDGVDYWWNDEGESYYFAFHDWNDAQIIAQTAFDATKRFFTINRSFTLGMQRLGATTWTGDIPVSWESMQNQPGYMLNWALSGSAFVTMDTGGFNGPDDSPSLLARWYQVAVFFPVMRVHSTLDDKPHFPFLYGDEAADAMRKAMNLRYQLLPYHYSLAHQSFRGGGKSIFRPMEVEFTDPAAASLTSQWMDGDFLLPCPIMNEDNSGSCYLPQGPAVWYQFNTTTTQQPGQRLDFSNVPLSTIPLYVRSGSILTLAPVLQYSDLLPGGPLQVQVYAGENSTFLFVEDDGETLGYKGGQTRRTTFKWTEATRTLSWKVDGRFSDSHTFTQVVVQAFFKDGTSKKSPGPTALGESGSVSF